MSKGTLFVLVSLVLFELTVCSDEVSKVINITSGPVRGYKSIEGDFFVFFGIPYATTPKGPHKFSAPLPPPVWTEPLDAVNSDIFCPQVRFPIHWAVTDKYQEDCLIVNVFVPDLLDTVRTNLSVVVYIHGGAYQTSSGNLLRPYEFMKEAKDVILVNFNYRLGVHGFLCLGTQDVPGNAGMKDQVAALKWIKKNIASFGGNSEDITLAGYSAGASAVDLLMMSDMAKGLFTKVIPESGVSNAVWSVQMEPLEIANKFARQLNFTTDSDDVYALEEFYKSLSYDLLTLDSFSKRYDHTLMFVPCIERDLGHKRFLKEAPVDVLKKKIFKKLPTLIGSANMEGLVRMDVFDEWKDVMNKDFSKFLPADLQFKDEEEKQLVALQIRKFYFNDQEINNDTKQAFFEFLGDGMFAYPILHNVKMQSEAGNDQIYLYQYTYTDDTIRSRYEYPDMKGAKHCAQSYAVLEDLEATFDTSYTVSEEYKKMKSVVRKLWINFIKTGKPVPEVTPDFPQGWPASSAQGSPYMDLNLPARLKGALLSERVAFWNSIYEAYYRKPVGV